jgi:hypothetical protein
VVSGALPAASRQRAARWWLVGDRLYYLGLVPARLGVAGGVAGALAGLLGFGWGWVGVAAVTFVAGAVVFATGSSLKGHAYELAPRDGITPEKSVPVRPNGWE